MIISKKTLFEENLNFFDEEISIFPYLKNKTEHYRLLSYLSKNNNNIIMIDAGTSFGHSCKAMSQNRENKIITYDIHEKNFSFFKEYGNIEFKKLDVNQESPEIINSAKIILLDIDPHDGDQEKKFTDFLIEIGYKGYVICDDIFLNESMKNWWDSIEIEKYDVTEIGHSTGTGIINFYQDGNFKLND
jgi:predicted O-methyltransferase YrrM